MKKTLNYKLIQKKFFRDEKIRIITVSFFSIGCIVFLVLFISALFMERIKPSLTETEGNVVVALLFVIVLLYSINTIKRSFSHMKEYRNMNTDNLFISLRTCYKKELDDRSDNYIYRLYFDGLSEFATNYFLYHRTNIGDKFYMVHAAHLKTAPGDVFIFPEKEYELDKELMRYFNE